MKIIRFQHSEPYSARHVHASGQLFLMTQGVAAFSTRTGGWIMTANQPCFVPPHVEHATRTFGPVEGISVLIDEDRCSQLPENAFVMPGIQLVRSLIDRLCELDAGNPRSSRLVAVLLDEVSSAPKSELNLPLAASDDLLLLQIQIQEDLGTRRTVEDWAAILSISSRTLIRRFRVETGMPFSTWCQKARVLKAIELHSLGHSLAEISRLVGYDSLAAFNSAFVQVTHMPPGRFFAQMSH